MLALCDTVVGVGDGLMDGDRLPGERVRNGETDWLPDRLVVGVRLQLEDGVREELGDDVPFREGDPVGESENEVEYVRKHVDVPEKL